MSSHWAVHIRGFKRKYLPKSERDEEFATGRASNYRQSISTNLTHVIIKNGH